MSAPCPNTVRLAAVIAAHRAQPQTAAFIDARIAALLAAATLTLPQPSKETT